MRTVLDAGYSFVEAGDGIEGVEIARELKPDLILLDLMLPAKSGFEVLKEIRQDRDLRKTPVIVVTAFAGEAERREAAVAGADRFLPKPFDPDELSALVEELFSRHG